MIKWLDQGRGREKWRTVYGTLEVIIPSQFGWPCMPVLGWGWKMNRKVIGTHISIASSKRHSVSVIIIWSDLLVCCTAQLIATQWSVVCDLEGCPLRTEIDLQRSPTTNKHQRPSSNVWNHIKLSFCRKNNSRSSSVKHNKHYQHADIISQIKEVDRGWFKGKDQR